MLFRNDTTTATTHSRICQGFLRAARSESGGLVKVHGRFGTAGKELQKCPNSKPRHSAMHHFFHSGIAIFQINFLLPNFPQKVFQIPGTKTCVAKGHATSMSNTSLDQASNNVCQTHTKSKWNFKQIGYLSIASNRRIGCPQIAVAIGVLTSNRGEGDEPLWRIGRGTRVPLQGAVDVVPLLGAIVGCHCSALWLGASVTTNFGGVDVVPLQGPMALQTTLFSTLITQKLFFAIWGLCWYNFF